MSVEIFKGEQMKSIAKLIIKKGFEPKLVKSLF